VIHNLVNWPQLDCCLRLRGLLVISEVALACVLLVGAGLLLRSFLRLTDIPLGHTSGDGHFKMAFQLVVQIILAALCVAQPSKRVHGFAPLLSRRM
jgi:hypothetical protein